VQPIRNINHRWPDIAFAAAVIVNGIVLQRCAGLLAVHFAFVVASEVAK
jgi:hypothetical protein